MRVRFDVKVYNFWVTFVEDVGDVPESDMAATANYLYSNDAEVFASLAHVGHRRDAAFSANLAACRYHGNWPDEGVMRLPVLTWDGLKWTYMEATQ